MWGLIAGGLASSLLGGKKEKKAADKAAQAALPWNIGGSLGSVVVDPITRKVSVQGDPLTDQLRGLLGQGALGFLQGGMTDPLQQFARQVGNQQLPGLFQGALDASMQLPTDALNSFSSGMSGLLGLAGQDVSGLIGDRLNLLRQQAAPFENRALNNLQTKLFGQGRLGSTGGGMQMEAFARGLGQADLARQVEAQNLGLQAQQQNLAQATGMAGMLGSQFGAQLDFTNLINTRAQQRMTDAMRLFGFGADIGAQEQQQGLGMLGGMQNIDQALRAMLQTSGGLSSQVPNTGSPTGSMLSGLGESLLSAGLDKWLGKSSGGNSDGD